MSQLKLRSSDNELFTVDTDIIRSCSKLIKSMLETLGERENDGDEEIPFPNVHSAILRKVIEWATHHKDDPQEPEEESDNKDKRTDDISGWDTDFLKVDQGTLFELILAANYLDIKGLLDVTCKKVANMMKGKTPEEIRKAFNIVGDLTEEKKAQIWKENEWGFQITYR